MHATPPPSHLFGSAQFDIAFPPESTNVDVYNGTIKNIVSGVWNGMNTTVFAYGATGSGKTHTMVGSTQVRHRAAFPARTQ